VAHPPDIAEHSSPAPSGDWLIHVGRAGIVVSPNACARRRPSSYEDAIVPSRHGLICDALLATPVPTPSPGLHPFTSEAGR